MSSAATTARKLVRKVCDDSGLPATVRRKAKRLLPLAQRQPDRVIERLKAIHLDITPKLTTQLPEIPYARCVSIDVFYNYHIKSNLYSVFSNAMDYRNYIGSSSDPATQLEKDLKDGIIIPAEYSWLVPYSSIHSSTARQIEVQLNFKQTPPYVIMVFAVDNLLGVGIRIREPRGTDTIPSELTEWYPGNVNNERINSDIPRSALSSIEWRP